MLPDLQYHTNFYKEQQILCKYTILVSIECLISNRNNFQKIYRRRSFQRPGKIVLIGIRHFPSSITDFRSHAPWRLQPMSACDAPRCVIDRFFAFQENSFILRNNTYFYHLSVITFFGSAISKHIFKGTTSFWKNIPFADEYGSDKRIKVATSQRGKDGARKKNNKRYCGGGSEEQRSGAWINSVIIPGPPPFPGWRATISKAASQGWSP